MKAIVYIRLSSFRGDHDPTTSPERQRASCLAYAEAKGWEVTDVVEDLNVSGTDRGMRLDRPGLRRVRDALPDVDVVLIAKLDRLARNVSDFAAFAEEARQHDAALVSVAESLDLTTPSGRFVATILAAFAEMEGATIAARTQAGQRAAARQGRWTGGRPPYGYRIADNPDGAGRVLALDPVEAANVRRAVDHILAGHSTYSAVQLLNAEGAKPRRAQKWTITSLRGILLGGSIRGHLTRGNGEPLRDEEGMPALILDPIVTPSEGLALEELILPRGTGQQARRRASRLASGLVRCSSCGSNMTIGVSNGGESYRCTNSPGCPCSVAIRAGRLDDFIEETYLDALGWMPVMETRLIDAGAADLAAVEREIAETTDGLREHGADLPALMDRLALLHSRREMLAEKPLREVETVATGQTLAEAWGDRDLVGRRALLTAAVASVTICPGKSSGRVLPVAQRADIEWRA